MVSRVATVASLVTLAALLACDRPPSAPTPVPCTYQVSETTKSMPSGGGSGSVVVTTSEDCGWVAASQAPWLSIAGPTSGRSGESAAFVAIANPSSTARQGTLTISGIVVTVSQEGRGPCTFDVSPQSVTFAAEGGTGSVGVVAPAACAWTAVSHDAWVTITGGATGSGDGKVAYAVATHPGSGERTATLTVASVTVVIHQTPAPVVPPPPAACTYGVSPTEYSLHWHGPGGEIALTTEPACTWTVDTGAEWLTLLTPGAGSGAAQVRFSASAFTSSTTRRAPVRLRWPTETAGQNVWVTQDGCWYAIGATQQDFTAAGGSQSVIVLGDPMNVNCSIGCPWTATTSVPWIHIVSSMPRAGDDQAIYQVDANATGLPRSGLIRVETSVLVVNQSN